MASNTELLHDHKKILYWSDCSSLKTSNVYSVTTFMIYANLYTHIAIINLRFICNPITQGTAYTAFDNLPLNVWKAYIYGSATHIGENNFVRTEISFSQFQIASVGYGGTFEQYFSGSVMFTGVNTLSPVYNKAVSA